MRIRATNTAPLIREDRRRLQAVVGPRATNSGFTQAFCSLSSSSSCSPSLPPVPNSTTTSTTTSSQPTLGTPHGTMTHFRIAVTSDTVCPWCYVGRKQLQRAQQMWAQRHPADTFAVTYHPFQLNPAQPKGPASSHDKRQFYHDKFGPERTQMMQQRLSAVGRDVGIDFKYGGSTGNTRDSHRLVHLAKRYGNDAELRVVDGLFAAYFENEADITQYDTLKGVATAAGIPEAEFQKAIVDGDEGGAAVDEAVMRARLEGVSGVPDYKIQDRFQINGGQPAEAFVQVFEKVKALEG